MLLLMEDGLLIVIGTHVKPASQCELIGITLKVDALTTVETES